MELIKIPGGAFINAKDVGAIVPREDGDGIKIVDPDELEIVFIENVTPEDVVNAMIRHQEEIGGIMIYDISEIKGGGADECVSF